MRRRLRKLALDVGEVEVWVRDAIVMVALKSFWNLLSMWVMLGVARMR